MRLAEFIEGHADTILAEWVAFAQTCGPTARVMDVVSLRDHAAAMLANIAADLRTPQSAFQQSDKSKGIVPPGVGDGPETAAEVHGAGRAESGFTIGEMVSEYRALRASVIRSCSARSSGSSRTAPPATRGAVSGWDSTSSSAS